MILRIGFLMRKTRVLGVHFRERGRGRGGMEICDIILRTDIVSDTDLFLSL